MLPVAVLLVVAAAGVVDAAPALSRLERTTTTSTAKKGAIKAKIHSHAKGNRSGLGRRDITDITNWNHDMMYSVEVAAG
jgi:hypothetical protein